MLSPAESVGLFGTTLDNRVRKAVQRVGDGTLARIADRLRIDAQANAVVYERNGVEEPVEKQRKQRGHTMIVSSGMENSRFLLTAKRKEPLVNSVLRHGSTGGTEFSCAEVTGSLQSTSPQQRSPCASAAANRTH